MNRRVTKQGCGTVHHSLLFIVHPPVYTQPEGHGRESFIEKALNVQKSLIIPHQKLRFSLLHSLQDNSHDNDN